MALYKAQVLPSLEYSTAAVYHACATTLDGIDQVQRRLLRYLGLSAEQALTEFSLAPLSARRDIAMLGVFCIRRWLVKAHLSWRRTLKQRNLVTSGPGGQRIAMRDR